MAKKILRSKTPKPILLDQINVNIGVTNWYKSKLSAVVQSMCADYEKELKTAYQSGVNYLANDAKSTSTQLEKALDSLTSKWSKRFADMADEVATGFADRSIRHTDMSLMNVLKKHDFTVKFSMSKPMQSATKAIVQENVSLIKSIQSQYHTQVETMTWESIKNGGDLGALTKNLSDRYGITLDRAAIIASDQNNKARGVVEELRRDELGIDEAIWIHSHAGKVPRQSHVDANGKKYKIKEGMLIDGEYIRPGQLINCRCGSRAIIRGIHGEE